MPEINFGLLDFGYREETMGSVRIQMDVIDYAAYADHLGFSRYWLAEHYFRKRRLAWTSPLPLLPLIAGATRRIRVGTAGVLLGIHQPLHVAAHFKLLNNLFANRIDLGLANGLVPGPVGRRTVGTGDNAAIREGFHGKLRELLDCLRREDELFASEGLVLPPYKGALPEVWSLSVSNHGLPRALDLKVNFARSVFHNGSDPAPQKELLLAFRQQYRERYHASPKVVLALSGCCQPDQARVKSVTAGLLFSDEQNLVCTTNEFHEKILWYQEEFGVDEFIFKDIARSPKDRRQTLELIADRFDLGRREQPRPDRVLAPAL